MCKSISCCDIIIILIWFLMISTWDDQLLKKLGTVLHVVQHIMHSHQKRTVKGRLNLRRWWQAGNWIQLKLSNAFTHAWQGGRNGHGAASKWLLHLFLPLLPWHLKIPRWQQPTAQIGNRIYVNAGAVNRSIHIIRLCHLPPIARAGVNAPWLYFFSRTESYGKTHDKKWSLNTLHLILMTQHWT